MKNLYLSILLLSTIFSCTDDDEIPSVTTSNVSFRISGLDYYAEKYQDTLIEVAEEIKFNHWNYNRNMYNDSLMILKMASFNFYDDRNPTCDQLTIKIVKREAKNNLVYDSYFSRWKYKNINDELQLFYQNYDSAFIVVEQCYLYTRFSSARSDNGFQIQEINKVLVNGEEDLAISATFEGKTYSESYSGEKLVYFDLEEGRFEGVLK